ncbi:TatD family hydrolase [Patescibacteria group bacterium]|nr:TatD family hydrolase [Patescibacteria group bacterium]MBU1890000.1 TatD family hydrolase [Patescibacteria group bacterium]
MQLIDTHAHLNYKAFNKDRSEVIQRCIDNNVQVLNASSQLSTSQQAVEIARAHPGQMFASVGFHPIHLDKKDYSIEDYQELITNNPEQIVAVGEIGLDYYHLESDNIDELKKRQKENFLTQLNLAQDNKLPTIIHCRDAYEDTLDILEGFSSKQEGVMHCYLGGRDIARRLISLGFYLGFTGIITFTNDEELLSVIKEVPLAKILIETDSPYLAPQPVRGKRNEPVYVKHVAEKIAQIKNTSIEEVAVTTSENARQLFRLNF